VRARIAVLAAASLLATVLAGGAHAAKIDRYYSKTYNDCMDSAGGSTLPMKECLGAEQDAWDKQLNAVYQTLMASRPAAEKIKLRDDERAWLKRSDHKCEHAGDAEEGGTLQGVEIDICDLNEKILRTLYLRGLK
jgi:uncharacterized protein YecT (DUF1311 family)